MGGTLPERLGRLPPIVYRGGVIRQISAGHRLLRDPVRANLVNMGRRAGVPLDRRNRNTVTERRLGALPYLSSAHGGRCLRSCARGPGLVG